MKSFKSFFEGIVIDMKTRKEIDPSQAVIKLKPATDAHVQKWASKHLSDEDGSSITIDAAYRHYKQWARDNGYEAYDHPHDFARNIPHTKARIAGALRFIGMKLKESINEGYADDLHNAGLDEPKFYEILDKIKADKSLTRKDHEDIMNDYLNRPTGGTYRFTAKSPEHAHKLIKKQFVERLQSKSKSDAIKRIYGESINEGIFYNETNDRNKEPFDIKVWRGMSADRVHKKYEEHLSNYHKLKLIANAPANSHSDVRLKQQAAKEMTIADRTLKMYRGHPNYDPKIGQALHASVAKTFSQPEKPKVARFDPAKYGMKKEDTIDEISKQKLTDYVLDARDDQEAAERQARHSYQGFRDKTQSPEKRKEFWDEYTWLSNKKKNREKGIKLALKKLDQ